MIKKLIITLFLYCPISAMADEPCHADEPCQVESGEYHLALPESWQEKKMLPGLLFFHGWGSSGRNVVRNTQLIGEFLDHGFIVIAPTGLRPRPQANRSWSHQGSPSQVRNEISFIEEVIEDTLKKVPLDRSNILVSGFSQGGSMVWHLACLDQNRFAAYAPVAGGFWEPAPEICSNGAFRLNHTHGLSDQVVPLEGRPIGRQWHQGDIFTGLRLFREEAQCGHRPDSFRSFGNTLCRKFEDCEGGNTIEICLHEGGHTIPKGWATQVIKWFQPGLE